MPHTPGFAALGTLVERTVALADPYDMIGVHILHDRVASLTWEVFYGVGERSRVGPVDRGDGRIGDRGGVDDGNLARAYFKK